MPARRKTLRELVLDETFLARRHSDRLTSEPLVDDAGLRQLQTRYRAESIPAARRALALEFQKAVRDPIQRVLHGLPADPV